jgi:hypothetical protein
MPKEFNSTCLYVCDKCLHFYTHPKELIRHSTKCRVTHPPGDEIYRDENISLFEVDPRMCATKRLYCENVVSNNTACTTIKCVSNNIFTQQQTSGTTIGSCPSLP